MLFYIYIRHVQKEKIVSVSYRFVKLLILVSCVCNEIIQNFSNGFKVFKSNSNLIGIKIIESI